MQHSILRDCQAPAAIAISLQRAVAETCGDENYAMGSHAFIHGDMIVEPSVGQAIACAMVILINNKEFQPLRKIYVSILAFLLSDNVKQ
jgi:hypothetical protein